MKNVVQVDIPNRISAFSSLGRILGRMDRRGQLDRLLELAYECREQEEESLREELAGEDTDLPRRSLVFKENMKLVFGMILDEVWAEQEVAVHPPSKNPLFVASSEPSPFSRNPNDKSQTEVKDIHGEEIVERARKPKKQETRKLKVSLTTRKIPNPKPETVKYSATPKNSQSKTQKNLVQSEFNKITGAGTFSKTKRVTMLGKETTETPASNKYETEVPRQTRGGTIDRSPRKFLVNERVASTSPGPVDYTTPHYLISK